MLSKDRKFFENVFSAFAKPQNHHYQFYKTVGSKTTEKQFNKLAEKHLMKCFCKIAKANAEIVKCKILNRSRNNATVRRHSRLFRTYQRNC